MYLAQLINHNFQTQNQQFQSNPQVASDYGQLQEQSLAMIDASGLSTLLNAFTGGSHGDLAQLDISQLIDWLIDWLINKIVALDDMGDDWTSLTGNNNEFILWFFVWNLWEIRLKFFDKFVLCTVYTVLSILTRLSSKIFNKF